MKFIDYLMALEAADKIAKVGDKEAEEFFGDSDFRSETTVIKDMDGDSFFMLRGESLLMTSGSERISFNLNAIDDFEKFEV